MKVLITDDDKLVALSLKTILESDADINVVDVCNSGEEAIEKYEKYLPDVLLMDIRMGGLSGLEASESILSKHREANILLLTTFSDDDYIVKAINLGVKGYIIKQDFESILPAIKAVKLGQNVFGGEIVNKFNSIFKSETESKTVSDDLSEKELDIASYVAKGLNNKEISEVLFLSEGTVRNYISNILDKLELRDRTQLAIYYLNNYK